jgi:hypothetical protein
MIYTHTIDSDIPARIVLRKTLINLMLKDLEFMEDVEKCDYCEGRSNGHEEGCVILDAALTAYSEKLEPLDIIKTALGDLLLADNILLGTTEYICPYCDEVATHNEDCVYARAIKVYTEDYP